MATIPAYNVSSLHYDTNCARVNEDQWNKLYEGAKRANKKVINRLIKMYLPWLYTDLALNLNNPYDYYRTDTHFIVIHSATDHFISFK